MGVKISGFDELDNKLESLGSVSKRIGQTSLRRGMQHSLEQLKKDAPKDTEKSSKALKVTKTKTYPKTGTCVIRAGIDKSNFSKTKNLYFLHYGFENKGLNFTGQRNATQHIGWVTKSFNKSLPKAEKEIVETVQAEIKKIIG